jgi:hypothetical protein
VLSCLPSKALVGLSTQSASPTSLTLNLIQAPKCSDHGVPYSIDGGYLSGCFSAFH